MMQFVRESDAVGAIIAGAGSRPAEELVTALRKGGYLRKYGRRGKPKLHWFRLSNDDKELLWDSSNGKIRSIALLSVSKIVQGQTTSVFKREPLPDYEAVSFSLLYSEGKGSAKERSLDVVCRNTQEFETWFLGIQLVIVLNQNLELQQHLAAANGQAAAVQAHGSGSGSATPLKKQSSLPVSPRRSDDRVDKIPEFRQIAASLQPVKAALSGSSQRSVGSQLPVPLKREIGDCYLWGSWGDAESCAADPFEGALQCSALPTMVANTHALDIIQVAVGARHAALMTRGGEVYTWGAGLGGNMGNGTGCGSNHPQQVTRLAGKGTAGVACGHSYTAAVQCDGSLHTWGSGLGGQLGLGPNVTTAVWPTRIFTGLEGVRVGQVSCGPYHAAAVGSDGRLFTWGDGLFGKLGHGDHCSAHNPRFVTTLAEHWVISVSCGWWHTAAAAVARSRLISRGTNSSASLDSYVSDADSINSAGMKRSASNSGSFLRGNILSSGTTSPVPPTPGAAAGSGRESTAAGVLAGRAADMGGAIFTWGGDFKWQQPWAKDSHQGCLGVGDLSGRLVPTLVKGEDNHVQVACGRNFTVALTTNGEVYQMGNTGAHNNREKDKADWKSALVPVLVRGLLSNHNAERLACGMSHVAVVATQRSKANSSNGSTPVTRLLTWGKNAAGQLGIGAGREDHFMPQVVSAVAGRRILFLACGGNYTLAVCEHDPRARWSRDSIDHDGLASAASGSLVSSSGPSRLHLAGVALTPVASGPSAADRALGAAAGNGGISTTPGVGQRAGGGGGLTVSASLSSLASSVQSGSRGEVGGGSGGGGGGLARKSDRGRLESRHSDRGFPAAAPAGNSSREHQGQHPLISSKSMGLLTRSLDRSLGGLGVVSAGGSGAHSHHHNHHQQQQQQQQGLGGCESRSVSWAPSPNDAGSRSLRAMLGNSSSKGFGSSSLNSGSNNLQLQDLSLQALATASKRSHLPLPKSFKKLAMGRSDSNSSSSKQASWNDWQSHHHHQGTARGAAAGGAAVGTPREQWALQGRSSSRQLSYSARSDPDLATVSATSSMTSAALSMTPSPSIHSLQEGRGPEGLGDGSQGAGGDVTEFQRQLRYWQERASNMEQQLSRRTHELEALRRKLRFSTSQGTNSDLQLHPSSSSIKPPDSGGRHSSGGGTAEGPSVVASSSLAVRRGLQPLPPVAAVRPFLDDAGDSDRLGQSSASSSIQTQGVASASTSVTPAGASSGASSGATGAAGASAAACLIAGAAAGSSPAAHEARLQHSQGQGPGAAVPPLIQSLDTFRSRSNEPESPSSSSPHSPSISMMQDAREDWGSPSSGGEPLPESPSAASVASASTSATTNTQGTGSPVLHRGTSLANWIGGDAGRVALLRSRATSAAHSNNASGSGASEGAEPHQQQTQQQQSAAVVPRRSTGESFVFTQPDKRQVAEAHSPLEALREVASSSSSEDSPFAAAAAAGGSSSPKQQRQRQRYSQQKPPQTCDDQPEQQQQLAQEDMFRSMSEHSKEASRVLALFQESQRHRQLMEQERRHSGTQPLDEQPSANGDSRDSLQAAGKSAVSPAGVRNGTAAGSTAGIAAAVNKAAASSGSSSRGDSDSGPVGVAAVGPVLPLDVDAAADDVPGMSPAALRELELLREQNRLLQQQLQELRQQQSPPPLAATLPAPVTVVAGRSSLGPSTSGAGALGSSLTKHRKTASVDIGSSSSITHEVARGVYLSLQALPDGGYDLKRVRFAKQMFSSEDAEQWWTTNRDRIYAAFRISQQPQQQHSQPGLWQQVQQPPPELTQQQQQVAGGGSSGSRPLVTLFNPHPLGAPAVNGPTLGGLRELRIKRSSNGDWTPPGTSPCINSPQSSMLELETLQLPPSVLLDEAFAAAAQATLGQDALQQLNRQQEQQLQQPRGWAGSVTPDGAVPYSSSLSAAVTDTAAAGAGSKAGMQAGGHSRVPQTAQQGDALDPQGVFLQVGNAAPTAASASSAGAEAGWQPVLPRKGSLGPAAAGPDTPAATSAAGVMAAASSSHKRSGSGLFRWLSKTDGSTAGSSGSQ